MALVERLREWRSATAAELGRAKGSRMPAYIVATDATLQAIAERQPANIDELAEIPGIGPRKVEAYGEQRSWRCWPRAISRAAAPTDRSRNPPASRTR